MAHTSTLDTLTGQFNSREYHDGSLVLNRLGFQVARTLVANARIGRARQARVHPPNPVRDALERDGAVRVPNFLPKESFAAVRDEFAAARGRGLLKTQPCVEDNNILEDVVGVGKNRQAFPVTWRALQEHQALRELVGDLIGRTPDSVALLISVMRQSQEPVTPARLLGTNYIHADAHFPTVKAWLYLNDVDESNGATIYALGSHLVTMGRLAYEYDASVRVARSKADGTMRTDTPYGKVRMPTAAQLRWMGVKEVSMSGKANTLFIANTMGFHRRGTFQPGRTRDLLAVRFGDRPGGKGGPTA